MFRFVHNVTGPSLGGKINDLKQSSLGAQIDVTLQEKKNIICRHNIWTKGNCVPEKCLFLKNRTNNFTQKTIKLSLVKMVIYIIRALTQS